MPDQNLNLNELNALFEAHFTLTGPLDEPEKILTEPIAEFGSGASLGDGKSMARAHGLKNIQVYAPDAKEPISLQTWLEQAVGRNPNPEAIADGVNKLLKNGQLSYFEQGRQRAGRLHLDPETNQLKTSYLDGSQPEFYEKPKKTIGQFFKSLWGGFKGPEREEYDRKMINYKMACGTRATSKNRNQQTWGDIYPNIAWGDGRGANLPVVREQYKPLNRNAESRYERNKLPREEQLLAAYESRVKTETDPVRKQEMQANLRQIQEKMEMRETENIISEKTPLKGAALNARQAEIFKMRYPDGPPQGISNFAEHRAAVIAKQEKGIEYALMRKNMFNEKNLSIYILSRMETENNIYHGENVDKMAKSPAIKELMRMPLKQLKEDHQILDRFAQCLTEKPQGLEFIQQEHVQSLLDHCLAPHKALSRIARNLPPEVEKTTEPQPTQQREMQKEAKPVVKSNGAEMR